MVDSKKIDLFERMPIPKAVFSLSVPTVISSLVMVVYNLADTYFVGILNDPVQNAAVTLAAPVILAFNAVNNLFGVGSSSMMSRALGRRDYETARQSSAVGFYAALVFSLLFSVLYTAGRIPLLGVLGADSETMGATGSYLMWTVSFGAAPAILNVVLAYLVRAEGSSLHASLGTMSGCILNILLDPIFILPWGLNLGAAGAGLATFLSNGAACLYFFILLFVKRKTTCVCIKPSMFTLKKEIVLGICGVGIPASIQNLLNVTGMTVLNNFTAVYGAAAVAAMGIAQKIYIIPMYIAQGISQGIMPLVSYNFASGDGSRVKRTIYFTLALLLCFMSASTLICFFSSDALVGLFIQNEEIIACGGRLLKGLCFAVLFLSVDFLAVGVFQACGMGKKSLLFAVLRKVVLEIPALIVLNRLYPLYGLSYAQLVAEIILAAAAVFELRRIIKKLNKREGRENT